MRSAPCDTIMSRLFWPSFCGSGRAIELLAANIGTPKTLENRTTADGQAPSRGVLRLALSHDRQNGGQRRRSPARGKTIINCESRRDLRERVAEKQTWDHNA